MAFFPFVISADQALKDFVDLGLNKQGKKSATIENVTGKSLSKALILGSTNPQYDKRLFIDLPVGYKSRTCCVHILFFVFTFRSIYVHNMFWACSFHVLNW